ncbi:MAG: hypothetical protein WCZ89_00110 [Phycisphaerae bacterium]
MRNMKKSILLIAIIGVMAVSVNAATNVNSDIAGPVIWTKANSPYHLKKQIFVLPGASLTMEAGVVVASFVDDQGSLAVTPGAKIYVMGTKDEPVIMTSAEDVANWTGSIVVRGGTGGTVSAITTMGDPKTGIWMERCNDWGNLTILGKGIISASHFGGAPIPGNTKCPTGVNMRQMEGLVAAFPGDPNVFYGGNDDDDDSGEIHYLSIRYGGKVIGLTNELNGLSLGGVGRQTEIDHVEIMNNVDDGIEIWGGTVNLKYISVWNIGDDSLDVDQGWRGCAQYGLIVQGHSVDAPQGSGVGDNAIEMDGAEDSDAQPMTTTRITNFTVVGQPIHGDHGTAWRDNARAQFDNCIFMDLGERLVQLDNVDGDGANGYGYNGTLSWANTWTTSLASWLSSAQGEINRCGVDLNDIYVAYSCADMNKPLASITNSVFYNNAFATAYTEATSRGVFNAANCNVIADINYMPIQELVRGPAVVKGGRTMLPVTFINPCAANDAVTSYTRVPACNCKDNNNRPAIMPAPFIGAFSPYYNWLEGWTATYAYGMTDTTMNTVSDSTSMSVPDDGDLNNDMKTDLFDLATLANSWLVKE